KWRWRPAADTRSPEAWKLQRAPPGLGPRDSAGTWPRPRTGTAGAGLRDCPTGKSLEDPYQDTCFRHGVPWPGRGWEKFVPKGVCYGCGGDWQFKGGLKVDINSSEYTGYKYFYNRPGYRVKARSCEDARFIHLNFILLAELMHFENDLQSEIETHRDVYASLTGTGRRLLGSLSSQEDAVMLQRRLDEMNQRWHHLKAKSMAIRNRLESNAEHWSALLLSLRELTEWVIRKETELTALAPPRGDLAALLKQQDDHRAFRRQLEDKRPVVESNLLSGRQYLAAEPLADASDTELTPLKHSSIPDHARPTPPHPVPPDCTIKASRESEGDSRGYRSAEEQARELARSIRREVAKLADTWNSLVDRSDAWGRCLDDAVQAYYLYLPGFTTIQINDHHGPSQSHYSVHCTTLRLEQLPASRNEQTLHWMMHSLGTLLLAFITVTLVNCRVLYVGTKRGLRLDTDVTELRGHNRKDLNPPRGQNLCPHTPKNTCIECFIV
ncbi:Dystrophin, isoform D, partial [Papilio machaon]